MRRIKRKRNEKMIIIRVNRRYESDGIIAYGPRVLLPGKMIDSRVNVRKRRESTTDS